MTLHVPASDTLPDVKAFTNLEVEMTVDTCVQSVSRSELRHICRDARHYLDGGSYHLLPRVLDLTADSETQALEHEWSIFQEADHCLKVTGHYVLAQDRFTLELELRNRRYRSMMFEADEALVKYEWDKVALRETIHMERQNTLLQERFFHKEMEKLKDNHSRET